MQQFLASLSLARKLMLAAIVLMAVSQFLPYSTAYRDAIMSGTSMPFAVNEGVDGTGWEVHGHALPMLLLLLGYFLSPLADDKGFGRFGWWVSVVALFITMMPGSPTPGVWVGLAAVGLAIVAAILNGRDVKRAAGGTPPPGP